MSKLLILGLDNGVQLTAQYNPKELGIDKSVPWQKSPTSSGDQPELQFTSAEGRSMSFELFFDEYDGAGNLTQYSDKAGNTTVNTVQANGDEAGAIALALENPYA